MGDAWDGRCCSDVGAGCDSGNGRRGGFQLVRDSELIYSLIYLTRIALAPFKRALSSETRQRTDT